ncbi:hypothetical protein ACOSQ2_005564 [Xanthoceras sorbifolium]
MGHVDAGKTKLLDFVRGTNVLEGEAGFLTQQIGATYFPAENIRERTKELKADAKMKVPSLLVIDTPGHESFTNLRNVVDIMEGLKPQTIESLNLLKMRNTEFIVALNKVDRLYGWKMCRNAPIVKALKQQSKDVRNQFKMKLIEKAMVEKLTFSNEVQCTVLEVKVIEGHGTTIDVVLVDGVIHEGDQIVVCGLQGPIITTIRALLTPHPMKELRVKFYVLKLHNLLSAFYLSIDFAKSGNILTMFLRQLCEI